MDRISRSCRKAIPVTATKTVGPIKVEGFYVNSTTAGTITFSDGATAIGGTITPAVGFHPYPYEFNTSCVMTVGGTLNMTLFGNDV